MGLGRDWSNNEEIYIVICICLYNLICQLCEYIYIYKLKFNEDHKQRASEIPLGYTFYEE